MKEIVELSNKEIIIERNEFLKIKGSIDTNLYYIESGSLRIFVLDNYEEQTIRFGYKENLIVALDSFLIFYMLINATNFKLHLQPKI